MSSLICQLTIISLFLYQATSISCVDDQVRLTGLSSPVIGRLEVCRNGSWAHVCNSNKEWTLRNSMVVCKMLGYGYSLNVGSIPSNRLAQDSTWMPFSYGNVKCLGLEGNLNECEVVGNTTQDCTQDDEVIIFCTNPKDGDVRLVGPGDDASGIVELYSTRYGWSTICINEWSDKEGSLVCQEVGYDSGDSSKSSYGSRSLPVRRYDYFQCTDNDKKLSQCAYVGPFPNGCSTSSRAAVTCKQTNKCAVKNLTIITLTALLLGILLILAVAIFISIYVKCKQKKKQSLLHQTIRNGHPDSWEYVPTTDSPPTYNESCGNDESTNSTSV